MSSSATVTSADRLTFTGFLATLLHAALILGISFTTSDRSQTSQTLEVTLASYKSDQAPDKADFLAQENQQGSGTLDEAKMLTTDVDAKFDANSIQEASPLEQQSSAPKVKPEQAALISSKNKNRFKTQLKPESEAVEPSAQPEGPKKSLLTRSLEIASLEARYDNLRQIYSKTPRIQRLSASSTLKANDAFYVNSWRRKIESMVRINFPREAYNCFTDCRLRFAVTINPNGTIHSLEIFESSGKKVLDDAAIRIVRRSAPFAPFTEEMKQSADLLQIIRTLQFKGNRFKMDVN
jgi:protein TonB